MPCRGSPDAPRFSGQPEDLAHYLDDVAQLCEATGSLDGSRKIKYALKYISREVEELWTLAAEESGGDWSEFLQKTARFYPEIDWDWKYSRAHLRDTVKRWASSPMTSRAHLGQYLRDFERIALYLVRKKRLSEEERNSLFLEGFNPGFKKDLLCRLSLSDLYHHPDDSWAVEETVLQAKFIPGTRECSPMQSESAATCSIPKISAPLTPFHQPVA
jgi:hypothetical protein